MMTDGSGATVTLTQGHDTLEVLETPATKVQMFFPFFQEIHV